MDDLDRKAAKFFGGLIGGVLLFAALLVWAIGAAERHSCESHGGQYVVGACVLPSGVVVGDGSGRCRR